MSIIDNSYEQRLKQQMKNLLWRFFHVDPWLLILLVVLACVGITILYSASNQNLPMIESQLLHIASGFFLMFLAAQITPRHYQQAAPWIYSIGVILLALVLVIGQIDQGGRRWFNLHIFHLQPSEIMKIGMPMMIAWYLSNKNLPPSSRVLMMAGILVIIPVLLTAKEPDLGTAIIIGTAGLAVIVLAGIYWRFMLTFLVGAIICLPILWHFMHPYQKARVLTFLNPERDPLGAGYHIIQSKIAIGSGGAFGKGFLNGTQSHLSFLPAHATDFIFAVSGEEFGFFGALVILLIFIAVFARCLYISIMAQNSFTRLLGGSISLVFILGAFVNIGMVIGILPVVGIPLPLISYGGSSLLMTMIGFGILMSIHTHRTLWST
jgi:rod shape determining protein RodA